MHILSTAPAPNRVIQPSKSVVLRLKMLFREGETEEVEEFGRQVCKCSIDNK